ncbi:MFS transporter, partial [Bacillus cereus]|uniref:MFS transporter n=1 Tax=Bacillus cereus TaxID=1396 RepID=UPI002852A1D3
MITITDAVEYGQWKNGTRNEAVTLSIRPLLDKIAGALSNGIVGFVAVAAGMTGNATAAGMYCTGCFDVPSLCVLPSSSTYDFLCYHFRMEDH